MFATHTGRLRLLALLLLTLAVLTVGAGTALAHEHRHVGPYELVVGWRNEPALAEQPNGLDLRVALEEDETPVEGLEGSLQAEVIFGNQTMPLELRPRFGQPGSYTADIIPTRAGSYVFHITGSIEGTAVDERFDSADGEFSDVRPLAEMQFPEAVRAGSEMQGSLVAAEAAANSARLFGIAGLVAGLLGLVVAGMALTRR